MVDAVVKVDSSVTSDKSNTTGKTCEVGRAVTEQEGWSIVAIAATWAGTPYSLVGGGSKKSVGGDCSGSTNKIFVEAGFAYPYQSTANFEAFAKKSNRFVEIKDSSGIQAGDILLWPGHMAIYAPFPANDPRYDGGLSKRGVKKYNNMYTAFNSRTGTPYGPYNIEVFRNDAYTVWRYQILPGDAGCN